MQGQAAFIWLFVFALGLALFLAMELRKWRRLGSILSRRQQTYRVANIGVLALIVGLLAVSVSDLVHSALVYMGLLTAVMLLLFVVMALTMRDLRELNATRTAREVRITEDIVRIIAEEASRERSIALSLGEDEAN